jgi:hypothetical protein
VAISRGYALTKYSDRGKRPQWVVRHTDGGVVLFSSRVKREAVEWMERREAQRLYRKELYERQCE